MQISLNSINTYITKRLYVRDFQCISTFFNTKLTYKSITLIAYDVRHVVSGCNGGELKLSSPDDLLTFLLPLLNVKTFTNQFV